MTQQKATERQVGGSHYKDLPIQPGKYIRTNGLGWYEGNIVKYITRYKQKGGRQDIEKVIHYAQLILEELDERETEQIDASGSPETPGVAATSGYEEV